MELPSLELSVRNVLLLGITYLVVCRLLRYRWVKRLHRKYPYGTKASLARMTNEEAWKIQEMIFSTEFPFTAEKGLQFALFRTYGIPTISKLLVQTRQLSELKNAGKRYADTTVLIGEFMAHSPNSERANSATARMNYIHGMYQKKGLISNDDMLYTLSLFAFEPMRWINRYEWRQLTPLEICAFGTFWKSQGDAMGISYADMAGFEKGWESGLEWMEALDAWSTAYEVRFMVPNEYNKKTADETTAILLYDVPKSWHPFGRAVVSALMDDRLRKAMMYEPPPRWMKNTIEAVFQIRKYLLRHAALPTPYFLRRRLLCDKPDKNGRLYVRIYESEPWYVAPTFANRWCLNSIVKRLGGHPIPGDKGNHFKPNGYAIPEIGPQIVAGKGLKEHDEVRDRLMKAGRGGCPFAG